MNEEKWLSGTKPVEMLDYLNYGPMMGVGSLVGNTHRKWTLFIFAYCQRFLPSLIDESIDAYVYEILDQGIPEQSMDPQRYPFMRIMGRGLISAITNKDENVCRFLRDIFANPFRHAQLDPTWLHWNAGTIVKLAQTIYDDRHFDDLPILADALEEAGCTEPAILEHCRGPGPHVRGCWVVDLLLGKP